MNKDYYIPYFEYLDRFFGMGCPVCFDAAELERLAGEWGDSVYTQCRPASRDDVRMWGVYDTDGGAI